MLHITDLMAEQIKTTIIMAASGVFVESIWQIKNKICFRKRKKIIAICDIIFWIVAVFVISAFLYYSSFGSITFHAVAGFLAGLLLWKKICCDIICSWVETDEAQSIKTTAGSSIWKKPDDKGWKKEKLNRQKKKKKRSVHRKETQGENGP